MGEQPAGLYEVRWATEVRPCSGLAGGSLAFNVRHWYIDNKGLWQEEIVPKASYRWFLRRAFRVYYQADRSVDRARVTPPDNARSDPVRDPKTSVRTATWLAWSLFAACAVLIALALSLDFLTDYVPLLPEERLDPGLAVLTAVLWLAYPTVGALIASRLPTNPIGWLFCTVGLLYAARRFTEAYADYALLEKPALPGGEYVAWFSTWEGFTYPLVVVFLLLLFPDG
jgi:hypothetical protein